jgi:hypothetical protein
MANDACIAAANMHISNTLFHNVACPMRSETTFDN